MLPCFILTAVSNPIDASTFLYIKKMLALAASSFVKQIVIFTHELF